MARAPAHWSRRSSYDTATSDTLTNYLNLSTSSQGRSSSGSLPFAEDSIRQNQQDWEAIERIFYGEDPLPEDEKSREEFQDWMETFPYLRIVGKKVNTERFRATGRNPIYHEEYLMRDPPESSALNRRTKEAAAVRHQHNCTQLGPSRSGHILTRRFVCDCGTELGNHHSREPSSSVLSSSSTLTPRNGTVAGERNKLLLTARNGFGWASNSANLLRLPSVGSRWSGGGGGGGGGGTGGQTTSRPTPLKSTVTLPVLSVGRLTFGDLLTTRSISALHHKAPATDSSTKRGMINLERR